MSRKVRLGMFLLVVLTSVLLREPQDALCAEGRVSSIAAALSGPGAVTITGEDDDAPSVGGEDDDAPSVGGEDDDAPSTSQATPTFRTSRPARAALPGAWWRWLTTRFTRGGAWFQGRSVSFHFTSD